MFLLFQVNSLDAIDNDLDGFTEDGGDCDDSDATISPLAEEECDGIDNDLDGLVDAGDAGCSDPSDEDEVTSTCSTLVLEGEESGVLGGGGGGGRGR